MVWMIIAMKNSPTGKRVISGIAVMAILAVIAAVLFPVFARMDYSKTMYRQMLADHSSNAPLRTIKPPPFLYFSWFRTPKHDSFNEVAVYSNGAVRR